MTDQEIAAANAAGQAAANFALRIELALVASSQNPGPVDSQSPEQVALRQAIAELARAARAA